MNSSFLVPFISRPPLEIFALDQRRRGFSLVELLGVIVIVSILASLSIVAFNRIGEDGKIAGALSDLSSLVDFAKTQAIAKDTYVRVGFMNQTTNGATELVAGAIASKDGSTDLTPSNLYQISRLVTLKGMRMTDRTALTQALTNRLAPITPSPVSVSTGKSNVSFSITAPGTNLVFSDSTITFTPQGEVMMNNPTVDTSYVPVLELGLQMTKGTIVPPNTPQGILWIYGASAQTRIFR